ncbi:MAG TPA: hypothetical protein VGR26_02515 [Acidimicrobiales bacterium]|nr:hypothetical protein [Acidimicrobiales bacterium]
MRRHAVVCRGNDRFGNVSQVGRGGPPWTPVIADFARCHRVVVPDAPGLGESAVVDRLDIEAFTRWFDTFLHLADLEVLGLDSSCARTGAGARSSLGAGGGG